MKVEIYSDVVCPWCYIGERRFERALADFSRAGEVEVVFRPYQLDPAAPEEAIPTKEALRRKYGENAGSMLLRVASVGVDEGIRFDWDRALSVNTRTAHRLLRLADLEYGPAMQRALMERLFARHFSEGGDVSDHETLAVEADAVGMEPHRTREYLASGEGTDKLDEEFDRARRLGVRAVPTFVFDGAWAVQGAQPVATFLEALEEAARAVDAAGEEAGSCEDGSCTI